MSKIIYGSICLSDIPKELIKTVTRKDGTTGKYLQLSVIEKKEPKTFEYPDGKSKTFTHFISCAPRKEEQVEGKNYILGDMQTWEGQPQPKAQAPITPEEVGSAPVANDVTDELPF